MPRPLSKSRQHKELIAAIRLGDMEGVKRWCSYIRPIEVKAIECIVLGKSSHDLVASMLELVIPHLSGNAVQQAFTYTILTANMSAFERVLPHVTQPNFNAALCSAARKGHLEMVERLLPFADVSYLQYEALKEALGRYFWPIVDVLLEQIDLSVVPNIVVQEVVHSAASSQNMDLLTRALPFNTQQLNAAYIVNAANNGRTDLVDVLYSHTDLSYVPTMLQVDLERGQISQENYDYLLYYPERQTHQKISGEIAAVGQPARNRKM